MEAEIPAPGRQPHPTHGLPNRLMGDERLAAEAGAGSERAFATLFQRYHQQLYRYCRGLTGSEQDAQDALQTTFTKALIAMREGRRNAPLRPWLYRIAHNESISVIRGRSAVGDELSLELQAGRAVMDTAEERERMATLVADLRELPEQQRGALVMRELSGLSHEEIAAALQVSVGAAKQSILEARRSLLEFAEGRAMTCEEIQRLVSDDDRRSLRSRRVRAHMRDCGVCTAFAKAIPQRRAEMLALWPALPAASAAGMLAKIMGGGVGHGGGSAGLAAGTAAKGIGATISIKAAAATGAAVLATATVGAVAVLHPHRTPASPAVPNAAAIHHKASETGHGSAATRAAASARHSTSSHPAIGKGRGSAVGRHTAGPSSHGSGTPSRGSGTSHGSNSSLAANGHGSGTSTAPGQTRNYGHSSIRSASASHRGPAHTTHGKPVKVNPSVHKSANAGVVHRKRATPHRATTVVKTKSRTHTRTTVSTKTKTKTTAAAKTTATKPIAPAATRTTGKSDATTPSTVASTTTPTVASTTVLTTASTPASSGGNGSSGAASLSSSAVSKNSK